MSGLLDAEVELPKSMLLTAIALANLGEPHACLGVDPVWYDGNEERERLQRFWASSAQRGLVEAGRLNGDFVDLLALLTRPRVECYGWIDGPHGGTAILAAAADGEAVFLRRDGDRVWLRSIYPDGLVEQVVTGLPEHPSGTGYSITVRHTEFDDRRSAEAGALRRLVAERRARSAQLYIARRGRDGRRQRIDRPLTLIDTAESGRWCTYLDTRDYAGAWIVAAPVYPQWLTARLREALRALR